MDIRQQIDELVAGLSTRRPGLITRVICNEDVWYLRLGKRLGVYRADLTHTMLGGGVLAVPRNEVDYWRQRLAEMRGGALADIHARALLLHEAVHARQMEGRCFWVWALRYVLSRRFRRRMEQEAYTVHLAYLALCGQVIRPAGWIEHLRTLYCGAFSGDRAKRAFDEIAQNVRRLVPGAQVAE